MASFVLVRSVESYPYNGYQLLAKIWVSTDERYPRTRFTEPFFLQPFRARISYITALVPRSNQYLRLFRVLLILEPFIRDVDVLSPGTKLLYDLSHFRVIMVVLCTCDLMR